MRFTESKINIITEWLVNCKKKLTTSGFHTFNRNEDCNDIIMNSLYELFEIYSSHEVISPVCHQLFEFYRSSNDELQKVTIELVPLLMEAYLLFVYENEKQKILPIETCLLGIYNLQVTERETQQSKIRTYTVPTVAVASCYHEPPSLTSLVLSDSALMKYQHDKNIIFRVGPFQQFSSINSQNRFTVLAHILRIYNSYIAQLNMLSRTNLCKWSSRLARSGYEEILFPASTVNEFLNDEIVKNYPRIPLTCEFLLELLHAIYFAMFNGSAKDGKIAVADIHIRAEYELMPEVLLVTNAIHHSLILNPSGQPEDGPIGIAISLSSTDKDRQLRKNALTNASFRSKRVNNDSEATTETELPPEYSEVIKEGRNNIENKQLQDIATSLADISIVTNN